MRTEIKVLWFDDDVSSDTVEHLKEICEKEFKKRGYICILEPFSEYEEAIKRLGKDQRIDIIFTDFNITKDVNGLTFYLDARNAGHLKQHIVLYSTDTVEKIKKEIIKLMNENSLSDFSNFSFFEVDVERLQQSGNHIENVINIYLSRWRELNALRGRIMNEHASLEYQLQCICGSTTIYSNLINKFKKLLNDSSKDSIFQEWHDKRLERNAFAHVDEEFDTNGYYIQLKDANKTKIYEYDIENKRKELISSVEKFQKLINKHKSV